MLFQATFVIHPNFDFTKFKVKFGYIQSQANCFEFYMSILVWCQILIQLVDKVIFTVLIHFKVVRSKIGLNLELKVVVFWGLILIFVLSIRLRRGGGVILITYRTLYIYIIL